MFRLDPHGEGDFDLVVTGDWTREAANVIASGKASGLVLNYARGFRERDLHFLEGLPIKRLDVLARTISDVAPIETLAATLQELSLQVSPRARVDLGLFPELRVLGVAWEQIENTIGDAYALEKLFLLSYRAPSLEALASVPTLSSIAMKDWPSLSSLDGLERFSNLRSLEVYLARELEDISALTAPNARALTKLALEGCRNFPDLVPVGNCAGLEELNVSECGDFPTLRPLGGLDSLRRLLIYGQTRIGDGDLSPLIGLPHLVELRMQQRRNYRPTVQDVQNAILA